MSVLTKLISELGPSGRKAAAEWSPWLGGLMEMSSAPAAIKMPAELLLVSQVRILITSLNYFLLLLTRS